MKNIEAYGIWRNYIKIIVYRDFHMLILITALRPNCMHARYM